MNLVFTMKATSSGSIISQFAGRITAYLDHLKDHKLNPKGHKGGYLAIYHDPFGLPNEQTVGMENPIALVFLGEESDPERISMCKSFAQEKCLRIMKNSDHRTSYESRNPEDNHWGGGLRICFTSSKITGRIIVSFSGCPELMDEAMIIIAAREILNSTISYGAAMPHEPKDWLGERENPFIQILLDFEKGDSKEKGQPVTLCAPSTPIEP